jgi:prepilin-type N-terminal cleavage/methylation domain-containing protein
MGQVQNQHRRSTPAGFTLVEILVSVALIALLIALLVPSLARARKQAREVVCAANLRSWGQAFHLYAQGFNGTLPHADDEGRNTPPDVCDPTHPEHESCYIDVLPPLMKRCAWRTFAQGSKPTGDVWQCPEAKPLPDSAYSPSYQPSIMGYHSYAMNSYLEYDFPFGREPGDREYAPFLKLNVCKAISRTLLLFEQTLDPQCGYGGQAGLSMAGRFTAEDARACAERHAHGAVGLGANVIMLDGHREWRRGLWNSNLGNPRIPDQGDLVWFPY